MRYAKGNHCILVHYTLLYKRDSRSLQVVNSFIMNSHTHCNNIYTHTYMDITNILGTIFTRKTVYAVLTKSRRPTIVHCNQSN